ncbi:MAG: hypothetical protein EOP58_12345 [Sphingomonadales bacterium]|nr:MAG: hypothetical protein EOP58_12345 [Sphingomonadales bacterium]
MRYVEKSGIFAAYCAHGVVPVCLDASPPGANGVVPGRNCLRLPPRPEDPDFRDADPLQAAARAWYEPHRLARTADRIAALLSA